MHIIVVGAGIAGVCSAWYLLKAGHQVTVVEALDEVANDTSFANAGMLTPGYASPWAAPVAWAVPLAWAGCAQRTAIRN